MKAKYENSRIEIWGRDYINNPVIREEKDKNVKIVQIEPSGREDDYIVEIVDREEAQKEQEGKT